MTIVFTLFFFCWLSTYSLEKCDKELIYYLEDVEDDEFQRVSGNGTFDSMVRSNDSTVKEKSSFTYQ